MAKQKLTEAKRVALRGEIERGLKAGTPKARIFSELAKKYGVSPETIRYYVKSQGKKPRPAPKKRNAGLAKAAGAPKKGKAPRTGKRIAPRPTRKASGKAISNGHGTLRIADAVNGLTAKDLGRALEARKLLPQLEASRAKASDLRSKAREAERQAARLERQFRILIR